MTPRDRDAEFYALGQIARSCDRTKIVRYLREYPGSYFAAIIAGTGINSTSLGKHLRDLEGQGVVVADLPMDERRGRSARWSIDLKRLRRILARFEKELLG